MEKNEKRKKFDSAIFRAYTDLVNNKIGYYEFEGKMKIQSITSIDMYTGEDILDEKTSFNHEVITSGNLKYGTLEETKNSLKMFKTFCDDYLIKMEESCGIPFGGSEIHTMMLMVSKENFVIDNVLYPYNEVKYNKILDVINSNDNLLRETMSLQTEEYMSKHISYDDTTISLLVDNKTNYKINCHTGDLSDEEINVKIVNPIKEIIKELLPEEKKGDITPEIIKLNSYENNLSFAEQSMQNDEIEELTKDIAVLKGQLNDHFDKIENNNNDRQIDLNKIKSMFFENNGEYFDSVSQYLVETFDYDILSNPTDTCVRFELCDVIKNKKMFFAINKNTFVLNDKYKYKLNLRGDTSNDAVISLINELKSVVSSWNLSCTDDGEYYWGLTICNENRCELYVGKSITGNWNDFTNIINKYIEELMKGIINEIII